MARRFRWIAIVIPAALAWCQAPAGPRSVAFSAIVGSGIATAIDTPADGSVYVAGMRGDARFPFTARFGQGTTPGFVVKLDAFGAQLAWAAAIAGIDAFGVAVGPDGSVVTVGREIGTGTPMVNAMQPAIAGSQDGLIVKLTPDSSRIAFSTYLGGVGFDHIHRVKVGADGVIHIAGGTHSEDFPATRRIGAGAPRHSENGDIFYMRLSADGSRILSSTLIGGTRTDWLTGMDIAADGRVILAGWTKSLDFPTGRAVQPALADVPDPARETQDGFVLRLNPDGESLDFSTYWGAAGFDVIADAKARPDGAIVVTGQTDSASQRLCANTAGGGNTDIFVSALDPLTSRALWSRCLGGSDYDISTAVAVGSAGQRVYVAGATQSTDFPATWPGLFGCSRDPARTGRDAYMATLDGDGHLLDVGRIGGDGEDLAFAVAARPSGGGVLLAGQTESAEFPTGPRGYLGPRHQPVSAWVMELAGQPTVPVLEEVLHSATYTSGAVSPGEIVSVFGFPIGPDCRSPYRVDGGRVPEELRGARVLFDGRPAPVLFASRRQVNAVAPFEISGSTRIELELDGVRSNPLERTVTAARPGIYALDESEHVAAINEDGSVNGPGLPAARGSIVAIYLTGGGLLSPPGTNGVIAPPSPPRLALPVTASIGGVDAEVVYAGAAPGLVYGAVQVNLRVPAGAPIGDAVEVRIRIGNAESGSGRVLAVR